MFVVFPESMVVVDTSPVIKPEETIVSTITTVNRIRKILNGMIFFYFAPPKKR